MPAETAAAGLARDSVALCHQITTLDPAKLLQLVGALPPAALRVVEGGTKAAIDLS